MYTWPVILRSGRNYAPGEKIELRDWDVKVLVES